MEEKRETEHMKTAEEHKQSNERRDEIIRIIESKNSTHAAIYPLLHTFETWLDEKDRRIRELSDELVKCEKTFGLIWKILDTLHNANSDDLQHLVDNIDIDLPLIQARIKDALNPPKP